MQNLASERPGLARLPTWYSVVAMLHFTLSWRHQRCQVSNSRMHAFGTRVAASEPNDQSPRMRVVFLVLAMIGGCAAGHAAEAQAKAHTASVRTENLRVMFCDNKAFGIHRAGYNGVADLSLATEDKNLFVPQVSGLNLEHIFSGDAASFGWNIFEPRRAAMELIRHSATRVELRQKRTENWPLRSELMFEVTGDAIDLNYCGTPLADLWRKHGYIGIFFASYIQKPEDMSIQFMGRARGATKARWIKHLPPNHGTAVNHRPAGSKWDPVFDEGFNLPLAKGFSEFEYLYPFYFGRSGEN